MYYEDDRGSHSQDSEAPPPVVSKGSYTNLYDCNDLPLGGSAHSLQPRNHVSADPRGGDAHYNNGGAAYNQAPRPPYHMTTRMSPGLAKRQQQPVQQQHYPYHHNRQAVTTPVTSPEDISPTSPLGIPLQNMKPRLVNSPSMDKALASDAKYPTNQALITDTLGPTPPRPVVATQKSSSTGQLSKNSSRPPLPHGSRTSPVTVGGQPGSYYNSRPPGHPQSNTAAVAGGKQLYNYPHVAPSNTGPVNKAPMYSKGPSAYSGNVPRKYKESGYSSSATNASSRHHQQQHMGGGDGRPPKQPQHHHHPQQHLDPSLEQVSNVPGIVRRPMSFVRALEMSDQIQVVEKDKETVVQQHPQYSNNSGRFNSRPSRTASLEVEDELSQSKQYGSSYEISV